MIHGNLRYLHLDFKGIVPSFDAVPEWLAYFRKCGFDGLVMEFDCRTAWKTFPGAGMPVYTAEQTAEIVKQAEQLGFDVIPLMQAQGHLEWLLGSDSYAYLRENGKLTLCPSHPEALPLLKAWMREIRGIFPHSDKIHIGADEVWVMGECPKCAEKAAKEGKMALYRDHVSALCQYAAELKMRPMIWADMVLRDTSGEVMKKLPRETVIVNWKYWGAGPYEGNDVLKAKGFEVWGASAIKCGWYENCRMMLNFPQDRMENVNGWNAFDGTVIHTNWGRPGNKWGMYPPWSMSVPLFIAAGNPERWAAHPWHDDFEKFCEVFRSGIEFRIQAFTEKMKNRKCADNFETQCLRYLLLGVRYQMLLNSYYFAFFGKRYTDAAIPHIGKQPEVYGPAFEDSFRILKENLTELMTDAAAFFTDSHFIGKEEYLQERASVFGFGMDVLPPDCRGVPKA